MLLSLAYIFILGFFLGSIFKKMNMPVLIGYLLAGILLGPYSFNLLDESLLEVGEVLKEIALLIILTQAGLSLELSDFKKMGTKAVFMSFVPACFEIAATYFLGQYLFNLSPIDSLLLGTIIASASPAVIVPRMLKLMREGYGVDKGIPQLILTGDSIDDVFNIVLFSSVLGLQSNSTISLVSFLVIPVSIVIGILVGIVIGYLISKIFSYIEDNIQVKTLLFLSVGFILLSIESTIGQFFPYSALISVMASGVTLLKINPDDAMGITNQTEKLWIGAQVLLFALVGATVNLAYMKTAGIAAIILLIGALIIRGIGIVLCVSFSDFTWKEKLFCTFTGVPKATVQAAIGGIPLAMGLASGEIILAISVISIIFTAPIGAILIDYFYPKLLTKD